MLKLEIGKVERNEELVKLNLYLERDMNGGIALKCTDFKGANWYILSITKEGFLDLYEDISSSIGLEVDKIGSIMLTGEED